MMSLWKREPITDASKLQELRISPSSINSFRQCPRKWFYVYVKAYSEPTTIHLVRGNIVHSVLEDIFKQRFVPAGEAFRPHMLKKTKQLFDSKWVETNILEMEKEELQTFYDESWIMLERFVNKFCDKIQEGIKIKKYQNETQGYYFTRPTFKELWLDDQFKTDFNEKWKSIKTKKEDKVPFDDTLNVGGFIDSVQKDFDNNLILVDYKTSSKYLNVLSNEYVLQLSIYAYLWQKQTGKLPAFVAINYLKYDESFYIKVTPSLVQDAKSKIRAMRSAIMSNKLDEEKYVARESKLCDWCNFQDKCSKVECNGD